MKNVDTIFTSSESSKTTFLLNKGIDFRFSSSYDPTEVTITDIENNNPTGYTLKKKIQQKPIGKILWILFARLYLKDLKIQKTKL